jgi:hypothetical protein
VTDTARPLYTIRPGATYASGCPILTSAEDAARTSAEVYVSEYDDITAPDSDGDVHIYLASNNALLGYVNVDFLVPAAGGFAPGVKARVLANPKFLEVDAASYFDADEIVTLVSRDGDNAWYVKHADDRMGAYGAVGGYNYVDETSLSLDLNEAPSAPQTNADALAAAQAEVARLEALVAAEGLEEAAAGIRLTVRQARALNSVLGVVGGDYSGPRGDLAALRDEFRAAGLAADTHRDGIVTNPMVAVYLADAWPEGL